MRLSFEGASSHPRIEGEDRQPGVVNFYRGKNPRHWQSGVPTFAGVRYGGLYQGIDFVIRATTKGLKSEYRVAPGADPSRILLLFEGVDEMTLREDGALVLETQLGEIVEQPPEVYQERDGNRIGIQAGYQLLGENQVGFQLGEYNPTYSLIIDPELVAAFAFGGSGNDVGRGIASDTDGNIIITGNTSSVDFPTMNAFDDTFGGGFFFGDAFVTKINPETEQILYSTYLGGTADNSGFAVTVDGQGNAYVLGTAGGNDFPTMNALQPNFGGGSDAFLAQLDSNGALVFSTFLGGNGFDEPRDIVLDGDGNLCFTGSTTSTNFPTQDPLQANLAGDRDAFVSRINPAGDTLLYSTYLGGDMEDFGTGIALDSEENVYVGGQTTSTDLATDDAFQTTLGGSADAFVLKFSPETNEIAWATYLGGSGRDRANGIDVDDSGRAYVAGETASPLFPLQDPEQDVFGGVGNFQGDAFVSILSPAGDALEFSTFIGGSQDDTAQAIQVVGNAVALVGTTASATAEFPFENVSEFGALGNGDGWAAAFTFEPGMSTATPGASQATLAQILPLQGSAEGFELVLIGGSERDGFFTLDRESTSGTVFAGGGTQSTGFEKSSGISPTQAQAEDILTALLSVGRAINNNLSIRKFVSNNEPVDGEEVMFTIEVTNIGELGTNIFLVQDFVPLTGLRLKRGSVTVSPSEFDNGCSIVRLFSDDLPEDIVIGCIIRPLPPNQTVVIKYLACALAHLGGDVVNRARAGPLTEASAVIRGPIRGRTTIHVNDSKPLAARGGSTFSELRWYPRVEAAKGSLSWVFRAKQPESVRTGP